VLHLLVRRQALIPGEHAPAPAAQQRAVRAVLEQPSLGEQRDGPDASARGVGRRELDAHVGDELGERARVHGLDHGVREPRRVGVGSMPRHPEG